MAVYICILNLSTKVLHSFNVHIKYQLSSLLHDLHYHCIKSHSRRGMSKVSSEKSKVRDTNSRSYSLNNDEEANMVLPCGMYFICALCLSKTNMREAFAYRQLEGISNIKPRKLTNTYARKEQRRENMSMKKCMYNVWKPDLSV